MIRAFRHPFQLLFSPDPAPGTLPDPAVIPPVPEPEPLPPTHGHPAFVKCGFCDSEITTKRGEVLRMSKRARDLRDGEETITRLEAVIQRLTTDCADLRAKLAPSGERPPASSLPGW